MQKINFFAVLIILLSLSGELLAQTSSFNYCSPVPGSKMVLTETNIILRSKNLLDTGTPLTGAYISIVGSKSGNHTSHAVISDDGKTMLFQPEKPFLFDEKVTVAFHSGLKTIFGEDIQPFTFSFTTQAGKIPFASLRNAMDDYPGNTSSETKAQTSDYGNTRSEMSNSLPQDLPPITITAYKPIPNGQLYFENNRNSPSIGYYLLNIATDGTVLNYKKTTLNAEDFRRQPNGLLSYFDHSTNGWVVMDSLYTVLNTYRAIGYASDPHEFLMLSNGHYLLLADDPEQVRMDTIVTGGNPNAVVTGIIIQEIDQDLNVVFQWRSWDHFKITDAMGINLTTATVDYCHSNALEIDYDGNILLSSRHLSEITKIDRTTGETIWRWGGKNNQFTFLGDTLKFTWQHAIRLIKNRHYTLFDNGDLHTPHFSRAVEYQLNEELKTATAVWEYRNNPDIYGSATGYVQRLDNGNTLICWGATNPNISLIAPDSSKIFDLTMPNGIWSYRAYMYPYTPPLLKVSPSAETLVVAHRSVLAESLKITNTTTSSLDFLVSNQQSWLTPGSSSYTIPALDTMFIPFTINTYGLLVGNSYTDTVTINGFDTLNTSIHIPVTIQVIGPKVIVSPTTISATVDTGFISQDSVKIYNTGSLPLIYQLINPDTSTQSWITFSSSVDTLAPGDSITQTIQFNAQTQSPGNYNTTLSVLYDSLTQSINVPIGVQVLPLTTIPVQVMTDWNLVSVPVQPPSDLHLPRARSSDAFIYVHSYIMTDNLSPGMGFWLKFDSAQTVPIAGKLISTDSVQVYTGWNIIGSISTPIMTSTITSDPPGIQTSSFYSYNGIYSTSDSILPGKGYWVKANQAGKLILTSNSSLHSQARIKISPAFERPPQPPVGSSSTAENTPEKYALEQAYPSPFNPTTTIRYQLPYESNVSLKVYTLLGKEVGTLQDGIEVAGYKSVVWDASNYASGVYFYRLIATSLEHPSETFSQIRKMVFVK